MRPAKCAHIWLLFVAGLFAQLVPAPAAPEETGNAAERRTERGPVTALVRIEPESIRIGDDTTLTLEVTAEPGVELLMPEFGTALERFRILEFVPRERIDEAGRTLSTQRYRLLPPASGRHTIPPIMVEFVDRRPGQRLAPENEDAYELLTESVEFSVESVVPDDAGGDLKPPLGALSALEQTEVQRWPWVTAVIAIALAGAVVLLFLIFRRPSSRASPYQMALARLDKLVARPRPNAEAMDDFFVELSDLVRHYLEDHFALHAPELTTEEFLDVAAGSPDLTADHRQFLQRFLRSADRVKFARHVPGQRDVEEILTAVRDFLQQTAAQTDRDHAHAGPTEEQVHA